MSIEPSHAKVGYWIDEGHVHQSTAYLTSQYDIDTEPGDLVHGTNKHSDEPLLLRVSDPLGGDHPYQLTQVHRIDAEEAIRLLARIDELTTEWEYALEFPGDTCTPGVQDEAAVRQLAAIYPEAKIVRRRARRDAGEWQEDPSE